MALDPLEPPRPDSASSSPAERLRDRVSEARASITHGIREAVDGLEREHRTEVQRSTDRIDAMVAERLATAEQTLAERIDGGLEQVRVQLEGGLADRVEQLVAAQTAALWKASEDSTRRLIAEHETLFRAEMEQRSRGALAAIEEAQGKVTDRLETAAEKLSRKARRHDLRMARKESNKRIEAALNTLEERSQQVRVEISAEAEAHRMAMEARATFVTDALDKHGAETANAGKRIDAALARLADGVQRAESALTEVARSERQIAQAQGRVARVEARLAEAADTTSKAASAELRIRQAADQEFEVAERIEAAEQRLRATLETKPSPESKAA